jgi:N-methylhydantoinase A
VDVISRLPLMTTQIRRALFDPATAAVALSSEVLRSDMTPGTCIAGPAVITEDETTIIVPTSRRATALADGCIDVSDKGADL